MQVLNPILQGFYPDPSVCHANGKYYMVTSSFQYFPGVPLFESDDLINWTQIGHCLTKPNQIALNKINSSGGVFAPTIRFNEGIFYMTTTNDTTHQNFYVWTEDIYSQWSDPIFVDQGGIDPSFYFEDGHAYFMSNGMDDQGIPGIVQCEIDIKTGEKLSPSKTIWQGTGGRFLESPHLYKIEDSYYLMAAEGGTEYGHMITYARGKDPFGPFTAYDKNPVVTNRNLGGYIIQGIGHGDLIQGPDGAYYIIHLGFRQTGMWSTFHHLGREVFIVPVFFDEDGWFYAADEGTTRFEVEIPHLHKGQKKITEESFLTTDWNLDWAFLRIPVKDNYYLGQDSLILKGTSIDLDQADTPTFIGLRQKDFNLDLSCDVIIDRGEGGITFYMDEHHHYDLAVRACGNGFEAILRLCIGNVKHIQGVHYLGHTSNVTLKTTSDSQTYTFSVQTPKGTFTLGQGLTRYLSSEVAGGFTGVVIGCYATSPEAVNEAVFSNFTNSYAYEIKA